MSFCIEGSLDESQIMESRYCCETQHTRSKPAKDMSLMYELSTYAGNYYLLSPMSCLEAKLMAADSNSSQSS